MSPSVDKQTPGAAVASSIAFGFAAGALLGTVLWLIEPILMYRRTLPYLGTPLVSILLLYAVCGAGVGVVAGLLSPMVARLVRLRTGAITFAAVGWVLTSLLLARNVTAGKVGDVPARELGLVVVALVVWVVIAVIAGRGRPQRSRAGVGIWAALAVVYLLVLGAWRPLFHERFPDRDAPSDAPDVVLIVVDALRPDHLGTYGYHRDTSPRLDELAAQGYVFENAYSHGNRTIFAMPALFTSMYPSINGAVGYETSMVPLEDDRTTIAEMLRDNGYATAGMMSNIYLKEAFGLTQGFDRTEEFNTMRFRFSVYRALRLLGVLEKPEHAQGISPRAYEVTDAGIDWLRRFNDDNPYFLFLHYMDVHHAYRPPPRFEEMFSSSPEADAIDELELFHKTAELVKDPPPLDFGGAEIDRLVDLYDACIRSTDDEIGRVLDAVRERARRTGRETVVVFTSDHGDEFMEHGSLYHVNLAYVELLRVPLIIWWSGSVGGPRTIDAMARHIDVLPTIADLVGASTPDSAMGESLVPVMTGEADRAARVTFAEGDFCTAMIYDQWKVLYVDTADAFKLYDLSTDPEGLTDVATAHPDVVADLGAMVARYVAEATARRGTQRSEANAETVRQLRALGYVN